MGDPSWIVMLCNVSQEPGQPHAMVREDKYCRRGSICGKDNFSKAPSITSYSIDVDCSYTLNSIRKQTTLTNSSKQILPIPYPPNVILGIIMCTFAYPEAVMLINLKPGHMPIPSNILNPTRNRPS